MKLDVPEDSSLRTRIRESSNDSGIVNLLLKECHLIEAALATHKIVISIETNCRDHFRNVSHAIKELRGIGWVNPTVPADNAVEWLASGALIKNCPRLAPGKAS